MNKLNDSMPVLAQPLRRVMELTELQPDDLVLMVANCSPETEEKAEHWHSVVTTVESSMLESGLHFAGPIWTVRLKADPEDYIYPDVMDPKEPANGVFSSGGAYWITQLYLLLSAAEIQQREALTK